jgi:outer membrane protein OmpA-like peptidoglycan-associated protein
MRKLYLTPVIVLVFGVGPFLAGPAFVLTTPALAQTQGDQRALDALGPTKGAATQSAHATATPHHHPAHHAAHAAVNHKQAPAKPAAVGPPPVIPAAPPPPPAFKAPVTDVPLHPEPPPPPVPVVATAVGTAGSIDGGSRITFGNGSADLNPATMQALLDFVAQLKANPDARAQIDAYSAGTADDPSTPRRMSLARGLAARAVLINGGIPSTRIYVRAIGQPHDSGPADRVDITRSDSTQHAADQPDAALGKAATAP